MLEGLTPSIGTVADALDNALAETTIGLYKTECTREGSPFRHGPLQTLADVEEATSAWVHWYNQQRLMHRLGRIPPAEAEADYHAQPHAAAGASSVSPAAGVQGDHVHSSIRARAPSPIEEGVKVESPQRSEENRP